MQDWTEKTDDRSNYRTNKYKAGRVFTLVTIYIFVVKEWFENECKKKTYLETTNVA